MPPACRSSLRTCATWFVGLPACLPRFWITCSYRSNTALLDSAVSAATVPFPHTCVLLRSAACLFRFWTCRSAAPACLPFMPACLLPFTCRTPATTCTDCLWLPGLPAHYRCVLPLLVPALAGLPGLYLLPAPAVPAACTMDAPRSSSDFTVLDSPPNLPPPAWFCRFPACRRSMRSAGFSACLPRFLFCLPAALRSAACLPAWITACCLHLPFSGFTSLRFPLPATAFCLLPPRSAPASAAPACRLLPFYWFLVYRSFCRSCHRSWIGSACGSGSFYLLLLPACLFSGSFLLPAWVLPFTAAVFALPVPACWILDAVLLRFLRSLPLPPTGLHTVFCLPPAAAAVVVLPFTVTCRLLVLPPPRLLPTCLRSVLLCRLRYHCLLHLPAVSCTCLPRSTVLHLLLPPLPAVYSYHRFVFPATVFYRFPAVLPRSLVTYRWISSPAVLQWTCGSPAVLRSFLPGLPALPAVACRSACTIRSAVRFWMRVTFSFGFSPACRFCVLHVFCRFSPAAFLPAFLPLPHRSFTTCLPFCHLLPFTSSACVRLCRYVSVSCRSTCCHRRSTVLDFCLLLPAPLSFSAFSRGLRCSWVVHVLHSLLGLYRFCCRFYTWSAFVLPPLDSGCLLPPPALLPAVLPAWIFLHLHADFRFPASAFCMPYSHTVLDATWISAPFRYRTCCVLPADAGFCLPLPFCTCNRQICRVCRSAAPACRRCVTAPACLLDYRLYCLDCTFLPFLPGYRSVVLHRSGSAAAYRSAHSPFLPFLVLRMLGCVLRMLALRSAAWVRSACHLPYAAAAVLLRFCYQRFLPPAAVAACLPPAACWVASSAALPAAASLAVFCLLRFLLGSGTLYFTCDLSLRSLPACRWTCRLPPFCLHVCTAVHRSAPAICHLRFAPAACVSACVSAAVSFCTVLVTWMWLPLPIDYSLLCLFSACRHSALRFSAFCHRYRSAVIVSQAPQTWMPWVVCHALPPTCRFLPLPPFLWVVSACCLPGFLPFCTAWMPFWNYLPGCRSLVSGTLGAAACLPLTCLPALPVLGAPPTCLPAWISTGADFTASAVCTVLCHLPLPAWISVPRLFLHHACRSCRLLSPLSVSTYLVLCRSIAAVWVDFPLRWSTFLELLRSTFSLDFCCTILLQFSRSFVLPAPPDRFLPAFYLHSRPAVTSLGGILCRLAAPFVTSFLCRYRFLRAPPFSRLSFCLPLLFYLPPPAFLQQPPAILFRYCDFLESFRYLCHHYLPPPATVLRFLEHRRFRFSCAFERLPAVSAPLGSAWPRVTVSAVSAVWITTAAPGYLPLPRAAFCRLFAPNACLPARVLRCVFCARSCLPFCRHWTFLPFTTVLHLPSYRFLRYGFTAQTPFCRSLARFLPFLRHVSAFSPATPPAARSHLRHTLHYLTTWVTCTCRFAMYLDCRIYLCRSSPATCRSRLPLPFTAGFVRHRRVLPATSWFCCRHLLHRFSFSTFVGLPTTCVSCVLPLPHTVVSQTCLDHVAWMPAIYAHVLEHRTAFCVSALPLTACRCQTATFCHLPAWVLTSATSPACVRLHRYLRKPADFCRFLPALLTSAVSGAVTVAGCRSRSCRTYLRFTGFHCRPAARLPACLLRVCLPAACRCTCHGFCVIAPGLTAVFSADPPALTCLPVLECLCRSACALPPVA